MVLDKNEPITRREFNEFKDKVRDRMVVLEKQIEAITGEYKPRPKWMLKDNGLPIA